MNAGSLHPRLVRGVTLFAAAVSLVLAIAVPATYFLVARNLEVLDAVRDVQQEARLLGDLVARNPTYWRFETTRIIALLTDQTRSGSAEAQRVLDEAGRVILELSAVLAAPVVTVREPILDAGRAVGTLEITVSLRRVVEETMWISGATFGLALIAFVALRILPLRLLQKATERATHLATHDALTGLPNRTQFRQSLSRTKARTRQLGGRLAVLMVDLDRFKPVNDVHGHAVGDLLLQQVAERLRHAVRESDSVARLGGDEFAIVARIEDEEVDGVDRLAQRIVSALGQPYKLGGTAVTISCSVGVASGAANSTDPALLADRADAALYYAKAEGRRCFRLFEDGMDARMTERSAMEPDLRHAIMSDDLVPYYQPLIDLRSGVLLGFEMLARWTHLQRGPISPDLFVPIAEEAGMIVAMTETLLRQACRDAAKWPDHLTIAVNVSPVQLRDEGLPAMIAKALAESGLPARRLEIELTESALITDYALAREILMQLKATGVRLVLDDFGTGYSSLRHLQTLPFDKFKVDAVLIRSMAESAQSPKVVAAIAGFGHSLGLPVVAEGIEDAATAATLTSMGYDIGQGWYFGLPIAAMAVDAMLAQDAVTIVDLKRANDDALRITAVAS